MKILDDYVECIFSDQIVINCINRDKKQYLKKMGAQRKLFSARVWILKYKKNDQKELGCFLGKLRNFGFCFSGAPAGWPPSEVFDYLREKNFVNGKFIEIRWCKHGKKLKYER